MRRLITFCYLLVCFVIANGQTTRNMWVGETFECDATSAVFGMTYDVNWSVSGGYYSWTGSGFYRKIQITQYFEGTMTVTCSWKYSLYYGDNLRTQTRTWYFTCQNNPLMMSPSQLELSVGERAYVSFGHVYTNSYSSFSRPYVQSDNRNVVRVDEYTGEVIAVGPGTAYINAYSKLSGDAPYCRVDVRKVDPTSVSIPEKMTVYVGESSNVTPTLYPENAQTTYRWYTDNSKIASINSGTITGVEEGETNVYVTTENGLRSNNCEVSVKYRVPTSITVDKGSLYLPIGQSQQLSAIITPSNARYTLGWFSSNTDVAEVTSGGLVKAKKTGIAYIKVTTDNGITATCTVVVPPNPEQISLPNKISLLHGKSRKLKYEVQPIDAYVSLQWNSSDTKVATVSSDGNVTAHIAGSAIVKATTSNGVSAECMVEVEPPLYKFVMWTHASEQVIFNLSEHPVLTKDGDMLYIRTSTSEFEVPEVDVKMFTFLDKTRESMPTAIDIESKLTLEYKTSTRIDYQLLPAEYDIDVQLLWHSDAPNVVSVANDGTITAVGPGEANITVTAPNGTFAVCRVLVPEPTYYLTTWLKNGRRDAYALSEHPVVVYGDNELQLTTSAQIVKYVASDVHKFTLSNTDESCEEDSTLAIENVKSSDAMHVSPGTIEFSGCKPDSEIKVYAINGTLIATYHVNANGYLLIQMQNYPVGIYIIKSETITHKIIRK